MKKLFIILACTYISTHAMENSKTPENLQDRLHKILECWHCKCTYKQATMYTPDYFKERDGKYNIPYHRIDTPEELLDYLENKHEAYHIQDVSEDKADSPHIEKHIHFAK